MSIRRVQFSEAGEGVELLFRNSDLRDLFNKMGPNYMQDIELGLNRYDADVIDKCLEAAAKKDGKRISIDQDALDVPRQVLVDKLLDAFSLSNNGRTYTGQIAWLVEEAKKQDGKNSPPVTSPGDSSAVSVETPSGPGSQPNPSGE